MILYKYYAPPPINQYSVGNIEDENICFCELDSFNDPFEGVGQFLYTITAEEQLYWDSIGSNLPLAIADRIQKESRELIKFKNRVFCTTEKNDNPLMWAHYAYSHQGFCVGYESKDIQKICTQLNKVNYCSTPPSISIENYDYKDILNLLFHKSDDWRYEEEWRAIYTLQPSDVEHLDYNSSLSHYFSPPPESNKLFIPNGHIQTKNLEILASSRYILLPCPPKSVYLGNRIGSELRNILIKICRNKSIPIYQMRMINNSFRLQSQQIY